MRRYIYNYQTIVSFSEPVRNHSVLLRCLPVEGTYMTHLDEHLIVSPGFSFCRGADQFGNRILYGGQRDAHSSLAYISAGIVSMSPYAVRGTEASPIYFAPSKLTAIGEEHRLSLSGHIVKDAEAIGHKVHEMMAYVPNSTTVETPAEKVLESLCGVCQDYAHLMIGLCRVSGIAARYACGFVEGEGQTHAWVEFHDGYGWLGYDPTFDVGIEYGYVKLAHGRDAADCPVSRGIYAGSGVQETQVNVTLKQL